MDKINKYLTKLAANRFEQHIMDSAGRMSAYDMSKKFGDQGALLSSAKKSLDKSKETPGLAGSYKKNSSALVRQSRMNLDRIGDPLSVGINHRYRRVDLPSLGKSKLVNVVGVNEKVPGKFLKPAVKPSTSFLSAVKELVRTVRK